MLEALARAARQRHGQRHRGGPDGARRRQRHDRPRAGPGGDRGHHGLAGDRRPRRRAQPRRRARGARRRRRDPRRDRRRARDQADDAGRPRGPGPPGRARAEEPGDRRAGRADRAVGRDPLGVREHRQPRHRAGRPPARALRRRASSSRPATSTLEAQTRTEVVIDDVPHGVGGHRGPPRRAAIGAGDAPGRTWRSTTAPGRSCPPDAAAPDPARRRGRPVPRDRAHRTCPNVELYGVDAGGVRRRRPSAPTAVLGPDHLRGLPAGHAARRPPILAIAPPQTSDLGEVAARSRTRASARSTRTSRSSSTSTCRRPHRQGAASSTLPAWARTVIPGPAGSPLLYIGERDGQPTAVLAFLPRDSDLPLQVAFPILIANLTGELLGGSTAPTEAVAPGDSGHPPGPGRRDRAEGDPARRHRRWSWCRRRPAAPSVAFSQTDLLGRLHRRRDRSRRRPPAPSAARRRRRRASGAAGPRRAGGPRRRRRCHRAAGRSERARAIRRGPVRPGESNIAPGSPPDRRARAAASRRPVARHSPAPSPARARPPRRAGGTAPAPASSAPSPATSCGSRSCSSSSSCSCAEWLVYHRDAVDPASGASLGRRRSGRRPDGGTRADGLSVFEAAIWLLLLVPALAPDVRAAPRRAPADGRGPPPRRARRPHGPPDALCPRARRLPAGPAGRPPRDRVRRRPVRQRRQRRPRGRARVPARDPRGDARGRPGGHRRVRQGRARRAAARGAPRASTGSRRTPVKAATDIGARAAPRRRAVPGRRRRSGSSSSRDGNDTTGRGQREAALAAARGHPGRDAGHRARRPRRGPRRAAHDAVDGPPRRGRSRRSPRSARRVAQPATVRLFADGALVATQPVQTSRPGANRVVFDVKPTEAGFHTFRVVVEAARDTFSQNDRADSNTIVKGEPRILVLAGDDTASPPSWSTRSRPRARTSTRSSPRPSRRTSRASSPTTASSSSTSRGCGFNDRQLAALQVYVRDLGRGWSWSAGRGQLRRRRLHEDADGGGAAGRHGRPQPAEAAGHRARRRHRQVGLDGRLPLQHLRRRDGRRRPASGRPQGRHRQGGDPARRGGPDGARRARRRRLRRVGPLGRPDPAARRQSATSQGQIAAHHAARPDEHLRRASTRRSSRSRRSTATRRHIILLTDGWSTSGAVRRDHRADEGGRDHALDRRRGRRLEPVPRAAREAGRRPVLRRGEPRLHPRHLPQGDPAGRRPADRRGGVLPDPDRHLADPARPRGRASRSSSATTARRSSRRRSRCSSRRATIRSSPSGSTASAGPWPGRPTRPGAGPRTGSAGRASRGSSASSSAGRSRARRRAASRRPSRRSDGRDAAARRERRGRRLAARLLPTTRRRRGAGPRAARGRRSTRSRRASTRPKLGEIDSGAYAVRITQTRPGASALGRTVGLVAPIAAEYRLLGVERAVPRRAAGRDRRARIATAARAVAPRPDAPRASFTELWPLLLVLALLLWPLDIALRRVSIGRRELALARGWVGRRWRRRRAAAPRTATGASMLAARERAAGGAVAGGAARRIRERDGRPTRRRRRRPAAARRVPSDAPAAAAPTAPARTRRAGRASEADADAATRRGRPAAAAGGTAAGRGARTARRTPPTPACRTRRDAPDRRLAAVWSRDGKGAATRSAAGARPLASRRARLAATALGPTGDSLRRDVPRSDPAAVAALLLSALVGRLRRRQHHAATRRAPADFADIARAGAPRHPHRERRLRRRRLHRPGADPDRDRLRCVRPRPDERRPDASLHLPEPRRLRDGCAGRSTAAPAASSPTPRPSSRSTSRRTSWPPRARGRQQFEAALRSGLKVAAGDGGAGSGGYGAD